MIILLNSNPREKSPWKNTFLMDGRSILRLRVMSGQVPLHETARVMWKRCIRSMSCQRPCQIRDLRSAGLRPVTHAIRLRAGDSVIIRAADPSASR